MLLESKVSELFDYNVLKNNLIYLKNSGVSMSPVLNPTGVNTDYVFLSRWAVRNYHVKRGDIVSLISPKSPDQTIIKRIVGLEGDVVKTLGYKNT